MDLLISVREDAPIPLYQQIYDHLHTAILSGRLGPGTRLPSSRALAQHVGVSRNTVTESYDQLLSEGYLESRVGAGTFVCRELPEHVLFAAASTRESAIQL